MIDKDKGGERRGVNLAAVDSVVCCDLGSAGMLSRVSLHSTREGIIPAPRSCDLKADRRLGRKCA